MIRKILILLSSLFILSTSYAGVNATGSYSIDGTPVITKTGDTVSFEFSDGTSVEGTTNVLTAADVSDFNAAVNTNENVIANNAKVTFPEAPSDGSQYARKNAGWEVISAGGGGAVASVRADDLVADALPAMRADQVSITTVTNPTASITLDVGFFEPSKRQTFSAWTATMPTNGTGSIIISYAYYAAVTNETFSSFVEYKIEGGSWQTVTTALITIPECSINDRAQYSVTFNLTNAVAGESILIAPGIADTNTTGTYSTDILVRNMTLDMLVE